MMKIKRQNKLMNYCAIPAGVLASAASVSGQTVIFYGQNSANDTNLDPNGIDVGFHTAGDVSDGASVVGSNRSLYFSVSVGNQFLFSQGADMQHSHSDVEGVYTKASKDTGGYVSFIVANASADVDPVFDFGSIAGSQNYANVSYDGDDGVFEAVAQFWFDGLGGGYLVAVAFEGEFDVVDPTNLASVESDQNITQTFSISDGAAAIAAASVPEPSSVALLALGATGLLMRRQRKAA